MTVNGPLVLLQTAVSAGHVDFQFTLKSPFVTHGYSFSFMT